MEKEVRKRIWSDGDFRVLILGLKFILLITSHWWEAQTSPSTPRRNVISYKTVAETVYAPD